MSTIFDNDVLIHHIASPGLPGDGFTAPEAATLRDDLDTLLARPVITELDDVPDVDAASAANGQALLYDSATDTWKPGASGGSVSYIETTPPTTVVMQDAERLTFRHGLLAVQSGVMPSRAIIDVNFGGNGVATSIARSDHTHAMPYIHRSPIAPQAYMSGGTRTFSVTNPVVHSGNSAKIEVKLRFQIRGGDSGASYYRLNVSIDGDTRSTGSGTNGLWCVQGVPKETELTHDVTVVGTGTPTSVAASVSWTGGGGFYTDAGEVEVKLTYAH